MLSPQPLVAATEALPPLMTPAPVGCVDMAEFVGDVTVPDNSIINAGERFDEAWRIRNQGTCTWGAGYQTVFVSGDIMGGQNSVACCGHPASAVPGGKGDWFPHLLAPTQFANGGVGAAPPPLDTTPSQ
jgi:hypothetical protein